MQAAADSILSGLKRAANKKNRDKDKDKVKEKAEGENKGKRRSEK